MRNLLVAALMITTPLLAIPVSAEMFPESVEGKVVDVEDGDGIWVDGYPLQIRLWGINAPEKHQADFKSSKAHLVTLSLGKHVTCQKKGENKARGTYKARLVGQCKLSDGTDLGKAMIDSGHAKEYCKFSNGYYGTCPN